MSSNSEIATLTKTYIKTAMLELLSKQSYDKISITELVKRAGVSRTAFYRNYASRDELIDDLVKDKADILTDSELIGKYLRISSAVDTGAKFVHEKWSRITGKLGNRRRANMSLTIMGKVKVNIPENEFDIEPGDREFPAFRSVCIIKDGSIWVPKIGVRLHSKKLIQKLKMIKVSETKTKKLNVKFLAIRDGVFCTVDKDDNIVEENIDVERLLLDTFDFQNGAIVEVVATEKTEEVSEAE